MILSGRVISPTWDRSEIQELYRKADVFVLPSRLETWGDVLLEAMAYALPCIGVSGQAMEEIIQDGQTGIIVPAEDAGALSEAMRAVLTHPGLARQFGCVGRERVEQQYTWAHVGERLAPVINQVWQECQRRMSFDGAHPALVPDATISLSGGSTS